MPQAPCPITYLKYTVYPFTLHVSLFFLWCGKYNTIKTSNVLYPHSSINILNLSPSWLIDVFRNSRQTGKLADWQQTNMEHVIYKGYFGSIIGTCCVPCQEYILNLSRFNNCQSANLPVYLGTGNFRKPWML